MKFIKTIGACVVVAAAVSGALASASLANAFGQEGFGPLAATPFSISASPSASASSPISNEMAVFTSQGISPARARQALWLQRQVAETHLAGRIRAALAGAYAGVWFEPAAARFHIGVTSNASRQTARSVVAQAGLTPEVVETPVRSTWAALIAAQNHWDTTHATLLANAGAMTGIDVPHNAVSVELSSSVSVPERARLQREAATVNVTVSVDVTLPSQFRLIRKAAKTCTAPFVEKAVYCEETLTSGVRIEEVGCTAGPLLISGNETYMLTAGHCFNEEEPPGPEPINVTVSSKYPAGGAKKEIGKEGTYYNNKERDMAEVRISAGSEFRQALPTPVPALMAEWVKEPKTPHAVEGVQAAEETIPAQAICHEGQASGENCGSVAKLNATGAGTEHVVEVTACSNKGDSGGPYFFRTGTGQILMMGTEVGGPNPDCKEAGPYKSYFEPLIGTPGVERYGILNTFTGQRLLTTATENRTKNEEEEVKAGSFWSVGGTRLAAGKTHFISTKIFKEGEKGHELKFETPSLGVTVSCTGLSFPFETGVILGSNTEEPGPNNEVAHFTGCTVEGNGTKCGVENKEITTKPIKSELVENVEGKAAGKALLVEFSPLSGEAFAELKFKEETGGKCTIKTTKVTGSTAAEVLNEKEEAVKIPNTLQEGTSWLTRFPTTGVKEVWLVKAGVGKVVEVGLTAFGSATREVGTALVLLAKVTGATLESEATTKWSPLP